MTNESRPQVVGRYMICDEIGAGGMATVHLGRVLGAAGFSRVVAIKRLHRHLLDSGKLTAMLVDEARIASRIRHPNVVAMIDVERVRDELLLIMEYVHGPSLAWLQSTLRLRKEILPVPVALRIALDVLDGLQAAHTATSERGRPLEIVHRDVSPQNILIGAQDGIARLTDFGIAKAEGRVSFTHDGEIKGKLSYMSREQLRGETTIDRRSDIYSLGVVLWEMLTGQRLFVLDATSDAARAARAAATVANATATMTVVPLSTLETPTFAESARAIAAAEAAAAAWASSQAKNPIELLLTMTADKPPSAFTSNVSAGLDAIVMKALRPKPEDRFADAEEMSAAIMKESANAHVATAREVAEHTRAIADAFLLQRREILERIEQVSMILTPSTKSTSTEAQPRTAVPSTSPMDHTLSLDPVEPARVVAPTVIDAPLVVAEEQAKTRLPLAIFMIGGGLALGLAAVMIFVVTKSRAAPPSPLPTTSAPGVASETPNVPPAKRRPNRRHNRQE